MSVDDDYLIPASRKAEAAEALYAATDWMDRSKSFMKVITDWMPIEDIKDDEEFKVTLTGAEIRALIDARRKARGE